MLKQKFSPTPPRQAIAPSTADKQGATVRCDECGDEVPAEKAVKSEAQDYLRHFCGLECYGKWRSRQNQ